MARNPLVQELLNDFVVPNNITGVRRAILILYRTLANSMANQATDSIELVEALSRLLSSRDKALVAVLNPRPVPGNLAPRKTGTALAAPTRITVTGEKE